MGNLIIAPINIPCEDSLLLPTLPRPWRIHLTALNKPETYTDSRMQNRPSIDVLYPRSWMPSLTLSWLGWVWLWYTSRVICAASHFYRCNCSGRYENVWYGRLYSRLWRRELAMVLEGRLRENGKKKVVKSLGRDGWYYILKIGRRKVHCWLDSQIE